MHWSEVEQLEQNNKFLSKYLKYFYYEEGGCGGDHLYSLEREETKVFKNCFQFLLKTPNFPHLSLFK